VEDLKIRGIFHFILVVRETESGIRVKKVLKIEKTSIGMAGKLLNVT
jgi:hypothetical protein